MRALAPGGVATRHGFHVLNVGRAIRAAGRRMTDTAVSLRRVLPGSPHGRFERAHLAANNAGANVPDAQACAAMKDGQMRLRSFRASTGTARAFLLSGRGLVGNRVAALNRCGPSATSVAQAAFVCSTTGSALMTWMIACSAASAPWPTRCLTCRSNAAEVSPGGNLASWPRSSSTASPVRRRSP